MVFNGLPRVSPGHFSRVSGVFPAVFAAFPMGVRRSFPGVSALLRGFLRVSGVFPGVFPGVSHGFRAFSPRVNVRSWSRR